MATYTKGMELSSDKGATKKLNDAIGTMIAVWDSPKADQEVAHEALKTVLDLEMRIDEDLRADDIRLTEWEARLFKITGVKFLDAGSMPVALIKLAAAVDEEHPMGYSGVSICTNLLEARGLVRNLTNGQLTMLMDSTHLARKSPAYIGNPEDKTGSIVLTEKGKLYYSKNCI